MRRCPYCDIGRCSWERRSASLGSEARKRLIRYDDVLLGDHDTLNNCLAELLRNHPLNRKRLSGKRQVSTVSENLRE
jgi:hypothetical protein